MSAREERRRRRSEDPITALHYQLSTSRAEAGLEALVLVDESGCLVAGAGAWPVCEELAAYAPLLARPEVANATVGTRIEALSGEVSVHAAAVEGVEVLLCGRGGAHTDAETIARALAGCQRILAARSAA